MPRPRSLFATLTCGLLLTGCADMRGGYPSLAIRQAERPSGSAMPVEPAPPPPPAPVATDTGQRIAQAVEQARKAHASFVAGAPGAARMVGAARGARAPADSWIAAQVALAGLQSLRSQAVIAQADLDLMFAQERLAEPDRITPTGQALIEARERVDRWVSEQDETLARLAGQLRI
jgi:hypothetical protein